MDLMRLAAAAQIVVLCVFPIFDADAGQTTDACMRMDLELTWLIEEHGERQDVKAEILAQAAFRRQDARSECQAGREDAALMIYELASDAIVNHRRPERSMSHLLSSD